MQLPKSAIIAFFTITLFLGSSEMYAQEVEIEGSGQIKNVKDPIEPQDAATKSYVDNLLLSFGVSMGATGIQHLLNTGYDPMYILAAGTPVDSLYGRIYQGGLIFYFDTLDVISGVNGYVSAPVIKV